MNEHELVQKAIPALIRQQQYAAVVQLLRELRRTQLTESETEVLFEKVPDVAKAWILLPFVPSEKLAGRLKTQIQFQAKHREKTGLQIAETYVQSLPESAREAWLIYLINECCEQSKFRDALRFCFQIQNGSKREQQYEELFAQVCRGRHINDVAYLYNGFIEAGITRTKRHYTLLKQCVETSYDVARLMSLYPRDLPQYHAALELLTTKDYEAHVLNLLEDYKKRVNRTDSFKNDPPQWIHIVHAAMIGRSPFHAQLLPQLLDTHDQQGVESTPAQLCQRVNNLLQEERWPSFLPATLANWLPDLEREELLYACYNKAKAERQPYVLLEVVRYLAYPSDIVRECLALALEHKWWWVAKELAQDLKGMNGYWKDVVAKLQKVTE